MHGQVWSMECVEMATRLWREGGHSAREIAKALADTHGFIVTKSGVIGAMYRRGIERPKKEGSPVRVYKRKKDLRDPFNGQKRSTKRQHMPVDLPAVQGDPPMAERITFDELTSTTCRWTFGDPKHPDFRFCGRQCRKDLPYCTTHMKTSRYV